MYMHTKQEYLDRNTIKADTLKIKQSMNFKIEGYYYIVVHWDKTICLFSV